MGHISAFALPNLKSWRCKICATFCSIDLAYRRDASCYSFRVNSGVSEGPHLEIDMKMDLSSRKISPWTVVFKFRRGRVSPRTDIRKQGH